MAIAKKKIVAKKVVPAAKKTIAAKKSSANMTPLEKARLARASGKSTTKRKAGTARPKPYGLFKAPKDFKPFFVEVAVRVDKDGVISNLKATKYRGRPDTENVKTVDLGLYEPQTLIKLAARLAGPSFVNKVDKRLPAGATAKIMYRVGKKAEGNVLTVGIKGISLKLDGDKTKFKPLEKSDPRYRVLRKSGHFTAAAYTQTKPFPSAAELKALNSEE